jgi:hypothetical protein
LRDRSFLLLVQVQFLRTAAGWGLRECQACTTEKRKRNRTCANVHSHDFLLLLGVHRPERPDRRYVAPTMHCCARSIIERGSRQN